jgi:hypothetical protein
MFGPKRDEVTGGWRKLYDEELHDLYSSPNNNIIGMIKSRSMTWTGHVARMGEIRNKYKFLMGSLKGRNHTEEMGVDGKIILKWILRN